MKDMLPYAASMCAALLCGWLFARRGLLPAKPSKALGIAIRILLLITLFVGIWAMFTSKSRPDSIPIQRLYPWRYAEPINLGHVACFVGGCVAGLKYSRRTSREGGRIWPQPNVASYPKILLFLWLVLFVSFMLTCGSGMVVQAALDPDLWGGPVALSLLLVCFHCVFLGIAFWQLRTLLYPPVGNSNGEGDPL